MILDTTYHDPKHKPIIEDLIGTSFSFLQRIKLKGIGSKRMIVEQVSPNLQFVMNLTSDLNYANIELRPSGILILINKGLKNFTWIIPYYQLVIHKTNGFSVHAQGKFIHFRNNRTFNENKTFFDKLLDQKVKFEMTHQIPQLS